MGISNNFAWLAPDVADMLDEAFERAGVSVGSIGNDHIASVFRSMRYQFNSEWLTLGFRQWMFELSNLTVQVGVPTYTLPPEQLFIVDAVLIRNNRATPINPISRTEYLEIPDKTQQGRPDRYMLDRQYNQVIAYFWRTPENSTDVIQYWAFKVNAQPGTNMSYQLAMPPYVLDAFIEGLAARIAQKHNGERYTSLMQSYCGGDVMNPRAIGGKLALALDADRETGDLRISISRRRRGR